MSCTCGCCRGTEVLTPASVENRPGLDALAYRVGTHASFLSSMMARLSGADSPALAQLGTRDPADPAIAVLDAWATIANVLSFYQERIAQEGYLRTALEQRSLLELARLVGYTPRPGVAASAYLAFTLESGQSATVPVGTRAQSLPAAGELPQPFETTETLAARAEWNLLVPRQTRPQWITLDRATPDAHTDVTLIDTVYFEGTATNLSSNDALLFVFGDPEGQQELRFVDAVVPDAKAGRTCVTLQPASAPGLTDALAKAIKPAMKKKTFTDPIVASLIESLGTAADAETSAAGLRRQALRLRTELRRVGSAGATTLANKLEAALRTASADEAVPRAADRGLDVLLGGLSTPPSLPPASRFELSRDPRTSWAEQSDFLPKLFTALRPAVSDRLYRALAGTRLDPRRPKVYALRLQASLYGHNAPKLPVISHGTVTGFLEWSVYPIGGTPLERTNIIDLAGSHPEVLPDSWLVVQTPASMRTKEALLFVRAGEPDAGVSRADYGTSGQVTRIRLEAGTRDGDVDWIDLSRAELEAGTQDDFSEIRRTRVYAQPDELRLTDQPILDPICGATLELDTLYEGLEPGRWLIVSGERTDVLGVTGLTDVELVMIADVRQELAVAGGLEQPLPDGPSRTILSLAGRDPARPGLAFCYGRSTVSIYGNVAHATHGETRREVLGSGDAAKAWQEFDLKQKPLTFVSAATPDGAASSLQVRADDVLWHEADGLGWLGPRDRRYVTRTDEKGKVLVRFGDGIHGLRPPTGVENVRALYRNGIGKPGNLAGGRINQLATRPLGVKSVINPLRSSGGAEPDGIDQTRSNVPLATSPLDRLVSVEDFADFARRFAGVGKASAARLSDGHAQIVHVTIAGVDDIPIDPSSDLMRNLGAALRLYGDPHQRVSLVVRESRLLVVSAGVKLLPDYEWASVEPRIRAALGRTFGFDQRLLGQSAFLSEAIAAVQQVPGVAYVDLNVFDAIAEGSELTDITRVASTLLRNEYVLARPDRPNPDPTDPDPDRRLLPAQLAWLSPDVPDTLILQAIP